MTQHSSVPYVLAEDVLDSPRSFEHFGQGRDASQTAPAGSPASVQMTQDEYRYYLDRVKRIYTPRLLNVAGANGSTIRVANYDSIHEQLLKIETAGGGTLLIPEATHADGAIISAAKSLMMPPNLRLLGRGHRSILTSYMADRITAGFTTSARGAMWCAGFPAAYAISFQGYSLYQGGQGATFNLTRTGTAITAATVASGGSGYLAGHTINVGNGTTLTVATVTPATSGRQAVATVTISAAGNWASAPSNPVAQVSSTGSGDAYRYDAGSALAMVDGISVEGLHLKTDRALTDPAMPTFNDQWSALYFWQVRNYKVKGCVVHDFPNTGILSYGFTSGTVIDNDFYNMGWGRAANQTNNAITATGRYISHPTQGPRDNTISCQILNNRMWDNGGCGVQYTYLDNAVFAHNVFGHHSGIGIEGEASSTQVKDTDATNGGVRMPGRIVIAHNMFNGQNKSQILGTTADMQDAISCGEGNDTVTRMILHNHICRITRYGALSTCLNGGTAIIHGNRFEDIGVAAGGGPSSGIPQVIWVFADWTQITNNRFTRCWKDDIIGFGGHVTNMLIDGNVFERTARNIVNGGTGTTIDQFSFCNNTVNMNGKNEAGTLNASSQLVILGQGAGVYIRQVRFDNNQLKDFASQFGLAFGSSVPKIGQLSVRGNQAGNTAAWGTLSGHASGFVRTSALNTVDQAIFFGNTLLGVQTGTTNLHDGNPSPGSFTNTIINASNSLVATAMT